MRAGGGFSGLALAGMLGGFATHVTLYAVGTIFNGGKVTAQHVAGFHPFMVGLLVSLVIAIVVTMATPPPPEHLVKRYFYQGKS